MEVDGGYLECSLWKESRKHTAKLTIELMPISLSLFFRRLVPME